MPPTIRGHRRLLQILINCDRVFKQFRTGFLGKAKPGTFLLGQLRSAVTRFSGRRRRAIRRRAQPARCRRQRSLSHEVSSAGLLAGHGAIDYPAFYSYAYPEPPGFRAAKVRPSAHLRRSAGEFILPYDAVRRLPIPTRRCSISCTAPTRPAAIAAELGSDALECAPGPAGRGAADLMLLCRVVRRSVTHRLARPRGLRLRLILLAS